MIMNITAFFNKAIFGNFAMAAQAPACPVTMGIADFLPHHPLWLQLVALFASAQAAVRNIGAAAMHCLLALCLALGATSGLGQTPAASSVDVPIGGHYVFKLSDFRFTDENGATVTAPISISSLPENGTLANTGPGGGLTGGDAFGFLPAPYFISDFADNEGVPFYAPPADAISVTSDYDRFRFFNNIQDPALVPPATMTINLVGASAQMSATGAPTVTAASGPTYNTGVPMTASVVGVVEPNGIAVSTLSWQWQQADAPASGVPMASAYSDIAGATATGTTSSDFTPLAAHEGKYIRVCASFMDQFSTAASEERCSTGSLVANVPFFGDASVDDQIWVTGTAITDLVLPAASGGNGTVTYSLAPALPTGLSFAAATRTISGTPTATAAAATYTLTATDTDSDTATLTFRIETAANATPAFATGATIADQSWVTHNGITRLTLPAATGGNGALTYALTPALPDGLSLDADTRTITGTPTEAAAQTTHTWTVADADNNTASGDTASLTFDITVAAGPGATDIAHTIVRPAAGIAITIPASLFINAWSHPEGKDLASVTPVGFRNADYLFGNSPLALNNVLPITDGDFVGGPLTLLHTFRNELEITFTLSDGTLSSNRATLTISFVQSATDPEEAVAVFNATAVASATDAIMGAMRATATDLSLDGTSIIGAARTLGQGTIASDGHTAWYHGTTAGWEYNAAYNASDTSAESLLHRLRSMADGDIAMSYSLTDTGTMRFWARYQSMDISGNNEGEALAYDGSGTGFYIGADRRINERMRLGLAISSDSADMTIDLDDDETNAKDEASRSATTIYPYMQMDLGNNNHLRVIAGIGSGDLDIKSTANSDETVSTGLSWNMLAASISHHRPMKGKLSARFDGSLQLGNSSTDAATFTANNATLAAADASTNELAIDAQLRYQSGNFTPHASITARKLGGDLSQSLAMDLGLGADLQTGAAIIRLSISRQLNDTDHKRDSLSLDIATRPNRSGITASLGSRYDSLSGRPQWQSTVRWQHRAAELSLAASQSDYRLQARLRW